MKKDPNIIRVGDTVKIINPLMFIRCGYPLCKQDMQKEIKEHFGNIINDLIFSVKNGNKFMPSNENPLLENKHRSYDDIIDALAYFRLASKNFGGNERSIHTRKCEWLMNKSGKVSEIRFVKTGIYRAGNGRGYYGDVESIPPSLKNEKTHKILKLYAPEYSSSNPIETWEEFTEIEIEATNVQKIDSIKGK